MTIRPIHLLGSADLRTRATEIGRVDEDVRRLVDDLFETMYADEGIGLAANQVGVIRRLAVVDPGENDRLVVRISRRQHDSRVAPVPVP